MITTIIPTINALWIIFSNWFGDDEVIFQDYNASSHRAKGIIAFLHERQIKSMLWPAKSPDVNVA